MAAYHVRIARPRSGAGCVNIPLIDLTLPRVTSMSRNRSAWRFQSCVYALPICWLFGGLSTTGYAEPASKSVVEPAVQRLWLNKDLDIDARAAALLKEMT